MNRYATGVDTRDLDLYESCFVEDVQVAGFTPETMHGRVELMTFVRKALERFGPTQHMIGNHVVALDGDAATMRSYVQATHVIAADPKKSLTLWATYHDALVRTPDGWRIRDHRLESHGTRMFTSS